VNKYLRTVASGWIFINIEPIKTLNRKPDKNKNIITAVSGAVVFVVMNNIITVGRGSWVHNARRRKLPRGP